MYRCTVYCVLCTVYCVLCTAYCVLRTVCCVLCTVFCVLVYCVLLFCVLCTACTLLVYGVWQMSVPAHTLPCGRVSVPPYRRCGPLTGAVRGAVPVLSARRAQPARDAVVGACVRATRVGHSNRTLTGSACHVSTEALQNTADRGVGWRRNSPTLQPPDSSQISFESPSVLFATERAVGSEDYSSVLKLLFFAWVSE